VVELLRGMARDTNAGPIWRATLAIGGKDGTLRGRLHGPATQGRVFAKTGTLDDVVALAGYAEGPHRNYVFALFFNEVRAPAGIYRAVHDRLLRRLLGS
jgi:D-alanyl-D-alanine carboxypeptidase/D-alanyl-D-alanine-endopeptidase (penicillin-binding protein 4)